MIKAWGRLDVSPGGLRREKVSEKDLTTVVIDGGNQGPLLFGQGRPHMKGGVMLYQCTNGSGQYLTVMNLSFPARFVAVQFLGPVNDGGDGHFDPFLIKSIS